MVTITYTHRGERILNVSDRASALDMSIRLASVLMIKKVAQGTDIKTYFGDFQTSDAFEDVKSAMEWNMPEPPREQTAIYKKKIWFRRFPSRANYFFLAIITKEIKKAPEIITIPNKSGLISSAMVTPFINWGRAQKAHQENVRHPPPINILTE